MHRTLMASRHPSVKTYTVAEVWGSARPEEEQLVAMQQEIFRFDWRETFDFLNRRTNPVPLVAIEPARTLRRASLDHGRDCDAAANWTPKAHAIGRRGSPTKVAQTPR